MSETFEELRQELYIRRTFVMENFRSNIFIQPTRTGGTVIRNYSNHIDYLFNHQKTGGMTLKHITFARASEIFGRDHYYYGVIRNPLERLVSIYYDTLTFHYMTFPIYERKLSFNEFVLEIENIHGNSKSLANKNQLTTQYEMLVNQNDQVDFIINSDNLKNDFVTLLNNIRNDNIPEFNIDDISYLIKDKKKIVNEDNSSEYQNAGNYPDERYYLEYYSQEALNYAKDYYNQDIQYFGYDV